MSPQHRNSRFIFLLFCFFNTTLFSQELIVSGLVRDRNTYHEIRSVNVFIKGSQIGTTSDFLGRYFLKISNPQRGMVVVFRHIGYVVREIKIDSLATMKNVDLQPTVIQLNRVEIEAEGVRRLEIEKDLPQTVSVIESRNFEIRGYVDAGDLLRTDHSVQVEEELSGKKTLSIRGGNADEVVVLFNGIKMNNSYNNIFDLSLIDLEDIERFELIKGSNTALYGPEAFSGVINIVSKTQQDYTIRFQQRLGTYRSGNWGLHLYKKLGRFFGSYALKRGGMSRTFADVPEDEGRLENSSLHHTGNLNYHLSNDGSGRSPGTLSAMWIYSTLDYENNRDSETLDNSNNMLSLKYSGQISKFKNIEMSVSFKKLQEKQTLNDLTFNLNRDIDDKAFYLNAQKSWNFENLDFLVSYQLQRNQLDFLDERRNIQETQIGLEGAELRRTHHGFVSILKYHGETGSDFLQTLDFDVSIRHDRVDDRQINPVLRSDLSNPSGLVAGLFENNNWRETIFKFAFNFSGYKEDLFVNTYLNFGTNTKFPTLFQQISSPFLFGETSTQPNLNPEKNQSFELGVKIARDIRDLSSIYGWQVNGSYFQNQYDNKFRIFTTPGVPVAFYDNVKTAKISGFEGKVSVFLYEKKISVDLGASKYFISEKAAFPFKSDFKRVMNFNVDHAGYAFQLHWFTENEQTGWLRFPNGEFAEVELSDNTNIDLHFSKTFSISKFKVFANASGRNLLNDDADLIGLAIRDRRFYLTLGAQY